MFDVFKYHSEIKQLFVFRSNICDFGTIEIKPFKSTNLLALSLMSVKAKNVIKYAFLPFGGAL
jgi:hypothetical protein